MTVVRPHLLATPHSGIRRMLELAREVPDPLLLVSGDPNFATPAHIVEGAAEAALGGATGYAPGEGFLPLREAITEKVARVNGITVEPGQVCVTTGACGGLFTSLMLVVEPGSEVLLPDPGWSNYAAMVHVLGGRPRTYPVGEGNQWQLDPAALEAAITRRTSAIVLNSPGNPSGVVLDSGALVRVAEIADRAGVTLISDEAYDELVYDGSPFSVGSRVESDQLVTVYTFSKTYAMTGWRIGYVIGRPDFVRQLSLHQEPIVSSASTISQHGALAALRGPQDCVREMVGAYRERSAQVRSCLSAAGIGVVEPGGSFFLMADIRDTALDSWTFAEQLLRRTGVGVVPGLAFGQESEGFVRISLAAAPGVLDEGMRRFTRLVEEMRWEARVAPGRGGSN